MSMKLLPSFQNKDKQQEEISRKILRSQEVERLAKEANFNLAKAEADFNSTLARNQAKWLLEEEEHMKMMNDRSKEIEALEKRKQQALIPIEIYKQEADKIMKNASDKLSKVKEQEEENDNLREKLEEKLTEVEDREVQLIKEEQKLEISREAIEIQKESTKNGIKLLSEEMIKFHEKQQYEENSLLLRKKEVSLAEITINAKIDKYKRDLEALKIWDIQLKDERATLDRTYNRLK